jgi:hypothetical protein
LGLFYWIVPEEAQELIDIKHNELHRIQSEVEAGGEVSDAEVKRLGWHNAVQQRLTITRQQHLIYKSSKRPPVTQGELL